jgi:hypothetical protein
MGQLVFQTDPLSLPPVGTASLTVAPEAALLIDHDDTLPQQIEQIAIRIVTEGMQAKRPTVHICLQVGGGGGRTCGVQLPASVGVSIAAVISSLTPS